MFICLLWFIFCWGVIRFVVVVDVNFGGVFVVGGVDWGRVFDNDCVMLLVFIICCLVCYRLMRLELN